MYLKFKKKSEGNDIIPQRVFKEGIDVFLKPLAIVFRLIYKKMVSLYIKLTLTVTNKYST